MDKPTKEKRYDFVNKELKKLAKGEKTNMIMQDRVYEVKYIGPRENVILFEDK